jgi:hypothetical protein
MGLKGRKGVATPEVQETARAKVAYAVTKITPEMHAMLKAEAERQGISPRAVVRQALAVHLGGESAMDSRTKAAMDALSVLEGAVERLTGAVDRLYADSVRAADRLDAVIAKADRA